MLCFQNLFVFIIENVPLFSAIKRRYYLISCLKALSPWWLGLNIYSNFNLSVSRTVKSFFMLAVALAAQVTWGRLRRGNEEQFHLGYMLRPVSSSIYTGERELRMLKEVIVFVSRQFSVILPRDWWRLRAAWISITGNRTKIRNTYLPNTAHRCQRYKNLLGPLVQILFHTDTRISNSQNSY